MPCDEKTGSCAAEQAEGKAADWANAECMCVTLDRQRLAALLDVELGESGAGDTLLASQSTLFAAAPVFIDPATLSAMTEVVAAIETVAKTPAFRSVVMSWAPSSAARDFGPKGALMGYDFHLTANGPRLIEINTNAGGAFLNALLADAQTQCCRETRPALAADISQDTFRTRIARMFEEEWHAQDRAGELESIAIVDDDPEGQPLFPEFLAGRTLLQEHGYEAVVAGPEDLELSPAGLLFEGRKIDLVYNRLVDFSLDRPESRTLREAYMTGRVVLSPNPHIHALYADKRNLCLLSDPDWLASSGLSERKQKVILAAVPKTTIVDRDNAETFWSERRDWFFKPARGYGSKAAYRGAKLTKRVWSEIVEGGYVAQRFTPPSTRKVRLETDIVELKVDVRLYTYAGEILLRAARLYQGQATNMRTLGGGFSPILPMPDDSACGFR